MKLIRLRVESFAAIGNVDVEFGPGLNVLYGPNDLGKSTMAESIRFALLLPHSSTHAEPYAGWTGGGDSVVELTFETETQRIWRVRKQFGKPGSTHCWRNREMAGISTKWGVRGRWTASCCERSCDGAFLSLAAGMPWACLPAFSRPRCCRRKRM